MKVRVAVVIASVALGYAGCALLPYVGAASDFCQTMYSGLAARGGANNHLFLPQLEWSNLGTYVESVRAEVGGAPVDDRDRARAAFLTGGSVLNLEAVRVAVAGLCGAGHTVRLSYRGGGDGGEHASADACADPALRPRAWLPVRVYGPERARR
jgi:hypothetical protein